MAPQGGKAREGDQKVGGQVRTWVGASSHNIGPEDVALGVLRGDLRWVDGRVPDVGVDVGVLVVYIDIVVVDVDVVVCGGPAKELGSAATHCHYLQYH
jgi:hypothetical protein